jgi:hypothetical protein
MLNVGCVTKLFAAATVKFLYSATDKTYFNCVIVIAIVIFDKDNKFINNSDSRADSFFLLKDTKPCKKRKNK